MVALQLPSASSAVDRNDMEDYHHGLMEQEYLRDTHDTFKKGQRPLLVGSGLLGTYTYYMLPYLREIFSLMNFKIVHYLEDERAEISRIVQYKSLH